MEKLRSNDSSASPPSHWYEPLLARYRAEVEAAIAALPHPCDNPRRGLGGALIMHLARTRGTSWTKQRRRAAAAVVESLNDRVFSTPSAEESRLRWLGTNIQQLERVFQHLHKRERPLLERVIARVLESPDTIADHQLPEAVLYLRGVVVAAVLAGSLPDSDHHTLDHWATWMGLCWEHAQGTLTESVWIGALHGIGVTTPYEPALAYTRARTLAGELDPTGHLSLLPTPASTERPLMRWKPHLLPLKQATLPDCPIEKTMLQVVHAQSPSLAQATRFLQHQGGKRLRPQMIRAAAHAVGGAPNDAALQAALVEWLHQASLLLDDIVDEATLRRGRPALHVLTDTPFALGCAGFILAQLYRASRPLPVEQQATLLDAARALARGQHEELVNTGNLALDLTGYYRIIEAKTARLFSRALQLGALAAGGSPEHVATLGEIGKEVGIAFQIVDDVLDYFGEESVLGKSPGTDWRAQKVTLPLLLVSDPGGTLPELLARMHDEDVRERCLSRARTHQARAFTSLSSLPNPEALEALITRCVARSR